MRKTAFLLTLIFLSCFLPKKTFASLSACEASVDPSWVYNDSSQDFVFTVTNKDSGGNKMRWVKFTPPSGNYTITSSDSFNDFEIEPDSPMNKTVSVNSSSAIGSSAWTVQIADNTDGSDPVACTGSVSTEIRDSSANYAPTISAITLSSVSSSSITISWTTNTNSTSELDYGLDSSYGSVQVDSGSTKTHSFTLSSLTSSTTYYFNIKATNDNGTTESGDNTFATSEPGATAAPTQTITRVVTPTPLPTGLPDKTLPQVSFNADFKKPFEKAPRITGVATDNKGVNSVDYSIDNGKNWLPVDELYSRGTKRVSFNFTPTDLEDGNYQVKVRAKDTSGNIGVSRAYEMVIDRLPPQIGGTYFSVGPLSLLPNENGVIIGLEGLSERLTFSAVGGPVSISLSYEGKKIKPVKNKNNGLWSTMLNFNSLGLFKIKSDVIDGAKNETKKDLNSVYILPDGKIIDAVTKHPIRNATITAYVFDPIINMFILWDAKAYSQENPQRVGGEGKYKLFLPPGKYYLRIAADKYKSAKTSIFTLDKNTPINVNFSLTKANILAIAGLQIVIPNFNTVEIPIKISGINIGPAVSTGNGLIGTSFPNINLNNESGNVNQNSFRGKKLLVTILNTWLPQASDQVKILENTGVSSLVIVPQESASRVNIYKRTGNYKINIIADPDGKLIQLLNVQAFPTHFFLDKSGVIKKIKSGLLTKEQIRKELAN
jgi:hypothetical protein